LAAVDYNCEEDIEDLYWYISITGLSKQIYNGNTRFKVTKK